MRWTRWTALGASMTAAVVAVATWSCAKPAQNTPAPLTQEQKVARGEYLTTIMGCNDCHTPGTFYGQPDFSRKLSGSELGWVGPWGTTYARNLSPDAETGLGSWSEDDIAKALRTGQRPNGTEILPPMPWPMYTNLTDDDVHSIAAYLKSLPAVSHKVPDKLAPGAKPAPNDWVLPKPLAWDAPKAAPDSAAAAH